MYRDLILSVVLPVHNRRDALAAYAARVLRVLEAGFVNHELVIVDDGSLDGSAEAARALVARNPNLRLVRLSRAYGTEIAIAAGLDQAIGDYVAVLSPELTDPVEQRRRFEAEMAEKERVYGERYPLDEDFLEALALMPPASGVALGFDRLVMLATGASRIEQVLWAPVVDGLPRP